MTIEEKIKQKIEFYKNKVDEYEDWFQQKSDLLLKYIVNDKNSETYLHDIIKTVNSMKELQSIIVDMEVNIDMLEGLLKEE